MGTNNKPTTYVSRCAGITAIFAVLSTPLFFYGLSEGATLENIHVSYGSISGTQSPLWIAKENGLFEKQGLAVNLIYISGGPRSAMAMLDGSVQFVDHSAMPSLEAFVGGADTALIGSTMNHLDHYLVVNPNIARIQDLRGKVIGISSLGSLTDVALREALRFNSLSERDVNILAVGDLSARMAALRVGTIQGTLLLGAQAVAAARMGYKELIDFSKLPLEISTSSILSRRTYVLKNSDTTLKFLKAWIEGVHFLKTNREASLHVIRKYTRTQDPKVLESVYSRYSNLHLRQPIPTPDGFVELRFLNELERFGFFEEMAQRYALAKN